MYLLSRVELPVVIDCPVASESVGNHIRLEHQSQQGWFFHSVSAILCSAAHKSNKFRAAMEKTRITIVAVTCIALFFLANYLFRYLIGFTGLVASLVIAALIAVYMSFSVARTLERLPMAEERSRALWIYGGFLGALFLAFGAWMFLDVGMDAVTLATLFLHYLPYPALAYVLLSDKAVGVFLKQDRPGG